MFNKLKKVFLNDSISRTQLMVKNVIFSFFTKGIIALIGLLLVPMMLQMLSKVEFGVWQTLSSILTWLYFLDIGLGNGFKNLFTQAIAENNNSIARQYLSTTYVIMFLITLVFILVFEVVNPFLDWGSILNFNSSQVQNFNIVIQVVFLTFGIKLSLSILNTALIANQQFTFSTLIEFFSSIFVIGIFEILLLMEIKSMLIIALISNLIPLILLVIASCFFYGFGSLKKYKPAIKFIDFGLSKIIFNKGVQFFFIQVSFVFMFTFNNIIVAQLFGPELVAELSVVSKYFSIPMMAFIIVLGPFWAGFTEAYYKLDFIWIGLTVKRLIFIWLVFLVLIWVMFFYFKVFCNLWIGSNFSYSNSMIFYYAVFASLATFNNIFSYFLNGIGKIRIQLIGAIFMGVISVPLSMILCKIPQIGPNGVLISNIICLFLGTIFGPIQYYLIIKKKANGIWLK